MIPIPLNHLLRRCTVLGVTALIPIAAQGGAFEVNGVCELGNCASIDSVSNGMLNVGNFAFNYVFGDGDSYRISGSYNAFYLTALGKGSGAFDPGFFSFTATITYVGLAPSVATDTLDLTLFQNYFDASGETWAGDYTEIVKLVSPPPSLTGPGTSIAAGLSYDGVSIGVIGPVDLGIYSVSLTTPLEFGAMNTAPLLTSAFQSNVVFGAGTVGGEMFIDAGAPEPASIFLCGLGLLMSAAGLRWRSRASTAV